MPEQTSSLASSWPLPVHGVRFETPRFLVKLLASHPLSCDAYPLATGYYPRARGHAMERREHDSHLLIYCVAGRGRLTTGAGEGPVEAGDLLCLPKGEAHAYRADEHEPWSIYWVHFDGDKAQEYLAFIDAEQPLCRLGVHPSLVASFTALFALRQGGYPERTFIHGSSQLRELLTGLGWWNTRTGIGKGSRINMEGVEQLMRRRITGTVRLEELADEAGMSRYYFVRRFREQTGHSPIQYFIHLKMQQACQLLDSDNRPVKQVAMTLGYEDVYYFSRLFKKIMGVSPRHYRKFRSA